MENTSVLTVSCSLAALFAPAIASAAISFPIEMPVDYCYDRGECYFMTVTVESDGSFVDSDRDAGAWRADRVSRELSLVYEFEDDRTTVEFAGVFERGCFTGDFFEDGREIGTWSSCLGG